MINTPTTEFTSVFWALSTRSDDPAVIHTAPPYTNIARNNAPAIPRRNRITRPMMSGIVVLPNGLCGALIELVEGAGASVLVLASGAVVDPGTNAGSLQVTGVPVLPAFNALQRVSQSVRHEASDAALEGASTVLLLHVGVHAPSTAKAIGTRNIRPLIKVVMANKPSEEILI